MRGGLEAIEEHLLLKLWDVTCGSNKYAFDGGGIIQVEESRVIHEGSNFFSYLQSLLISGCHCELQYSGLSPLFSSANSLQNVLGNGRPARMVILDTKNASHHASAVYHTGTRFIYSDYSDIHLTLRFASSSSRSHHAISRSSPMTTNDTNPLCLQPDTAVRNTIQHQLQLSHTRRINLTSFNTTTVTHPYPTTSCSTIVVSYCTTILTPTRTYRHLV